jgi:hypothetical protein
MNQTTQLTQDLIHLVKKRQGNRIIFNTFAMLIMKK